MNYRHCRRLVGRRKVGQLWKVVYGLGIDEPICMIVVDGETETPYYYHFDALGSVVALSNNSGEIAETYSYDVYGEPSNTSSVGNPYLFTGRRYDAEACLYYYRARYYNSYIGRFLQTDPVGYEAGLNLYTYVRNNPALYVDPSGLWECNWADLGFCLLQQWDNVLKELPFWSFCGIICRACIVGVGWIHNPACWGCAVCAAKALAYVAECIAYNCCL